MAWKDIFLASPLLFFVSIMIIEPLTSPHTKMLRAAFGAFIGAALFLIQHIAPQVLFSMELSLLTGNIFARSMRSFHLQ